MITIPTSDLVGLLTDVLPFASTDDEIPALHCVRVEWDGRQLHTVASDRYRIGWATWEPGDIPPDEEVQDDLFTEWGGADGPWAFTIPLPDAQELAKVFKLPAKEGRTPLVVDHDAERRRLSVRRNRDTGHSAITIAIDDPNVEWPDPRKLLAAADGRETAVKDVAYTAKFLADFAKVRAHGPLQLTFTEGQNRPEGLTRVTIGTRFIGAIMPTSSGDGSR